MINDNVTTRDLASFTITELAKYLRLNGFKNSEEKRFTYIYSKSFAQYDEVINLPVPKEINIINYNENIYNILKILGSVLNESIRDIVRKIILVSNDSMKMRLINLKNYSRSIPLDIASNEVYALKQFIVYGASSEEKPRPFFEKPSTVGTNHGNQCQFGHTFEGSFGFTINSPIIEDYTQLTFEKESISIPFERKVMQRIVNGFINTDNALLNKSTDPIVENFENGFNSKMCDALIDMSNENMNFLKFEIEWSPQIEISKEIKHYEIPIIRPESIEILREASTKLKEVEPFEDFIIGRIVTLHSNKSPFLAEEFPRIAIIKHFFENHPIDVKLELSMEQYKKAYDAHGKGQTIKVIGKIYRKGNTWRMVDISSLEIFPSL